MISFISEQGVAPGVLTGVVLEADKWQSGSPCHTNGRLVDLIPQLIAFLFHRRWKHWEKSNSSFAFLSFFFFLEVPKSEMPNGKCQLGGNSCFSSHVNVVWNILTKLIQALTNPLIVTTNLNYNTKPQLIFLKDTSEIEVFSKLHMFSISNSKTIKL